MLIACNLKPFVKSEGIFIVTGSHVLLKSDSISKKVLDYWTL